VILWDLATGKAVHTMEGHAGYVRCVTFTPDGRRALSGSYDHTARLWDLATGRNLDSFEVHDKPVLSLTLSPDGKRALSGGGDGMIMSWSLKE
jgi:WD40 repeat protein